MDSDLKKFTKCDIFTPKKISKIMISKLKNSGNLLEPSVGTGNLLKYINIDNYDSIDVYELKKSYLNKIKKIEIINKYNKDFIKTDIKIKYDNIIMNPPYIRVQDLSVDYRNYLKENYDILNNGLVDIYYAFIIKCLELLKDDGIMISITPNTYLYNKSSLKLRKYLFDNRYIEEIIDFKDEKVFPNVSVYCCITIFTKNNKKFLIYNNKKIKYTDIIKNYSIFNMNNDINTLNNICKITNGIATLRDKIFIHDEKLFDEPCWHKITNGKKDRYIIYPYNNGIILEEDIFKTNNPLTFNYLLENKNELDNRDKGKKKYPKWYSYGRTQSLCINKDECIYIPCFLYPKKIKESIFIKKDTLHYSCLCIRPYDKNNIDTIISIIINNIDFIENNSSKRSGGWINISSRILNKITIN